LPIGRIGGDDVLKVLVPLLRESPDNALPARVFLLIEEILNWVVAR
jgi:hypothetical protein